MGRGASPYQASLCWEHARVIRATRRMRPSAPTGVVGTGSSGNGEVGHGNDYGSPIAVSLRELDLP